MRQAVSAPKSAEHLNRAWAGLSAPTAFQGTLDGPCRLRAPANLLVGHMLYAATKPALSAFTRAKPHMSNETPSNEVPVHVQLQRPQWGAPSCAR